MKISSSNNLQLAQIKNPQCLSGGKKLNSTKPLTFPPEFGDFLRRNLHFLVKRSSLDFFVTFCVKTKSKRNNLAKRQRRFADSNKNIKIRESMLHLLFQDKQFLMVR